MGILNLLMVFAALAIPIFLAWVIVSLMSASHPGKLKKKSRNETTDRI
jgi:hypothetical protein